MLKEAVKATTRYRVECWRPRPGFRRLAILAQRVPSLERLVRRRLAWADSFENLVVTIGLNLLLDRSFNTPGADANWYVGLKGAGAPAAGDTMASHATWAEITPYSNATRPTWTKNGAAAAGAMSNSASKAAFTINASATVVGAFMTTDSTKGGTTGSLYGAGDFAASRAVISGDTLNVQVDLSVTAA